MHTSRPIAAALLLFLAGCPELSAIWIDQGSTTAHLVFRLADKRGGTRPPFVGVFRVDRCVPDTTRPGPRPMWGAGVGREAKNAELSKIQYGVLPPGYEKLMGQADTALTLTPGCYRATMDGTGSTTFDVLPDGTIRERPPEHQ